MNQNRREPLDLPLCGLAAFAFERRRPRQARTATGVRQTADERTTISGGDPMKTTVLCVVATLLSAPLGAQEKKPVPKDSVRVFVPGCSKGLIFTAGERTEDAPGAPVP